MERYDYLEAVINDVENVVRNDYDYITEIKTDIEAFQDRLNEELWTNDSVTGNDSGSYTFSTWQAEENICHNLELLAEACEAFGCDTNILARGAEACDVTIRCYLLSQAIDEVLNKLNNEIAESEA